MICVLRFTFCGVHVGVAEVQGAEGAGSHAKAQRNIFCSSVLLSFWTKGHKYIFNFYASVLIISRRGGRDAGSAKN